MGETNRPILLRVGCALPQLKKFLAPFNDILRRIPIQIKIPSLAERTQAERKQLIMRAFYEEQQAIQKQLLSRHKLSNF